MIEKQLQFTGKCGIVRADYSTGANGGPHLVIVTLSQ